MENFIVKWEIDIENSSSPKDAAKKAWEYMRKPDSIACVFTVENTKNADTYRVDLWENEVEKISEERKGTYSVFKYPESKDYIYLVHPDKDSTITMVNSYSSISRTYTGTTIEAFGTSLRGLLRYYPNFIEKFDEFQPEKFLEEQGFKKVEPSKTEKLIYRLPD